MKTKSFAYVIFSGFEKGFKSEKSNDKIFLVFFILRMGLNILNWIKVFVKESKMEKSLHEIKVF